MSRGSLFHVLVVAGFVLVAGGCAPTAGDASDNEPGSVASVPVAEVDDLGECPAPQEGESGNPTPLHDLVGSIDEVVRLDSGAVRAEALRAQPLPDDQHAFDLTAVLSRAESLGVRRSAPTKSQLLIGALDMPDLQRLPDGMTLLMGLEGLRDGRVLTRLIAVEQGDGDLSFVGHCARNYPGSTLRRFHSQRDASGSLRDLVIELATSDAAVEDLRLWAVGPAPVAWADRDPRERVLDVKETPEDVLATMDVFSLGITVPEALTKLDVGICTWVIEGWNECYDLAALGEEDDTVVELLGFARPGDVVEVWLVAGNGPSTPIGRIGDFTLPTGVAAGNLRITGAIQAPTAPSTTADLKSAVDAGHISLSDVQTP